MVEKVMSNIGVRAFLHVKKGTYAEYSLSGIDEKNFEEFKKVCDENNYSYGWGSIGKYPISLFVSSVMKTSLNKLLKGFDNEN